MKRPSTVGSLSSGFVIGGQQALAPRPNLPIGVSRNPAITVTRSLSWKAAYFPILFFEAYLLASIVLFTFGPIDHYIPSPFVFYSYVFLGQFAIFIGYNWGISCRSCGYSGLVPINNLIKVAIICAIAMLFVTYFFRNYAGLSIFEALKNPAAAYRVRNSMVTGRDAVPLASIVRTFIGPITGLLLPVGIVYWRRMSNVWRSLWFMGMLLFPLDSIISGSAKSFFDMIAILPWILWLHTKNSATQKAAASGNRSYIRPRSRTRKYLPVAITVVVLLASFAYLNLSRQSRYNLKGDQYPPGSTGWSSDMYGVHIPESIEYTIYNLNGSWASGYQGLAGCLDLPFEWCYGCGHSIFWMYYADKLSSSPEIVWDKCYPARLEATTGYYALYSWHTIYPWLASDLTFPGAILFMGLMACLFAMAWRDSLLGENPFAVACLAQFLLMFYYIPANNCRLTFSEELMTFWTLLAVWLMTRKTLYRNRNVKHALAS